MSTSSTESDPCIVERPKNIRFFYCSHCDTVAEISPLSSQIKCRNCKHHHSLRHIFAHDTHHHDELGYINIDGCDKCVVYKFCFRYSCWSCGGLRGTAGLWDDKCYLCGYGLDSSWSHTWVVKLECALTALDYWTPTFLGWPETFKQHGSRELAERGYSGNLLVKANGKPPTEGRIRKHYERTLRVDQPVVTKKIKVFWKKYVEDYWRTWEDQSWESYRMWVKLMKWKGYNGPSPRSSPVLASSSNSTTNVSGNITIQGRYSLRPRARGAVRL